MVQDHKSLIKISQMLYSITKMDTMCLDQNRNILFQLIDHSVPSVLAHHDDEYSHIHEVLCHQSTNHYYHFINTYGLEYIAVGIWRGPTFCGSMRVGPFISNMAVIDLIKDIISRNHLPIGERKQLEQFYQSLPVLSEPEYKNLGELLVHVCAHDYISSQQISTSTPKPLLNQDTLKVSIEENKDIIENRYKTQNRLMDAVAKGDKSEVNNILHSTTDILDFSDRIPESPIRSAKNMAIVINTLYRIAAERSGVHPVYLHNISERFAILIERTTTLPNLKKITVLMTNEYCDLVNTFATGDYSPIIKRTIDFILLNLGSTLTLTKIAHEIHVNPSHLSRKFKEETGMNITEFINSKRVEEAKLYLQKGHISITDVAFLVGFNDLNYFSKVFKKYTSLTPSQFPRRESR